MEQLYAHTIKCTPLKKSQIKKLREKGGYYFISVSGSNMNPHSKFCYELIHAESIEKELNRLKIEYEVLS